MGSSLYRGETLDNFFEPFSGCEGPVVGGIRIFPPAEKAFFGVGCGVEEGEGVAFSFF